MPPVKCWLLSALLFTLSVDAGTLRSFKLDVANNLTGLYFDGQPYSDALYHNDNWKRVDRFNVPAETCVIAISARCTQGTNCFAGIMLSESTCQSYSNSTTCKCTKSVENIVHQWTKKNFRDDNWPNAREHYSVAGDNSPYRVLASHFCDDAWWVWTASIYNEEVYCRCQLSVNGGWSDWSTCVNGQQSRTCTNPAPICNGLLCDGTDTQSCSSDGTHTSCSDGCSSCDISGVCSTCSNGFYLSSGTCTSCGQGCATCNSRGCTACATGYYSSGNSDNMAQCKACIAGCASCTNSRTCDSCSVGYFLSAKRTSCTSMSGVLK